MASNPNPKPPPTTASTLKTLNPAPSKASYRLETLDSPTHPPTHSPNHPPTCLPTHHHHHHRSYDLSPIKVVIVEQRSSFLHFLTNVCAIVGGVFTVSGIVDAVWYTGQKIVRKKMELGKFS